MDVNDMRAFQQVARSLSFSAAGQAMSVRKSAVSRSIKRLEDALKVRLFERTTREVALTEGGRALLLRFDDILARVDSTVEFAANLSVRPSGRIKVTAGIGFGIEVVSELLPAFSLDFPDVQVMLDLTSRTVDLIGEQVDVAFRMGPLADSSLVAMRLGSIACQLCAAPSYIDRRGWPENPEDLQDHSLLTIPRGNNLPRRWTLCDKQGRSYEFEVPTSLGANDPHALHRMVLNGAGITATANYIALPEIERGTLIRILPEWRVPSVDVSLVMPPGRDRSPAVRAFVAFIRRETAGNARWFEA